MRIRSPTADPKSSRDRVVRAVLLILSFLAILFLIRLTFSTSSLSASFATPAHLRPSLTDPSSFSTATTSGVAHPANLTRVLAITNDNRNDLVYLHKSNIMFMTMAKAGTSSTWHWIYPGVTGHKRYDKKVCKTYIHDIDGPCWRDEASFVYKLPPAEQWKIFTSPQTLRVAIQRDPYSRLISSFKSKFTCEDERFGTDVHNRLFMVPALRRQAGWGTGRSCMNISEFAEALEATRKGVHAGKSRISSLRLMDVHIRPQEMYFDEIDYQMVLDVTDLSDVKNLEPIIKRLRFQELVKDGITLRHSSGGSELLIPDRAAGLLHNFALESKVGEVKYYRQ